MNEQIKRDMELLKDIEVWPLVACDFTPYHKVINIEKVQALLEAQARITAHETERRVRAEMKAKIGAMCGIPDAGDACRAILNYLSNPITFKDV